MKKSILLSLLFTSNLVYAQQKVIQLYQGIAPGSENWTQKEREMIYPGTNIMLLQNVTQPTLRVFLPDSIKANGTAVILAPGGGFETEVDGVEGTPVAKWLNAHGIIVFVLRYTNYRKTSSLDATLQIP